MSIEINTLGGYMRRLIRAVVMLVIFTACTGNHFISDDTGSQADQSVKEKISLTINFKTTPINSTKSRSVVADFESLISAWTVTMTSHDGYTQKKSETVKDSSVTIDGIEPGIWDVKVTGTDVSGNILATGTATACDLTTGLIKQITVPITFLQDGTGSFTLSLNYPVITGINSVSCTAIDGKTVSINTTNDAVSYTTVIEGTNIKSGNYILRITFKRDDKIAGVFCEAVNIWDNTLSNRWIGSDGTLAAARVFEETDFFDANANLASLNIGGKNIDLANLNDADATSDNPCINITGSVDGQKIEYQWGTGVLTQTFSGAAINQDLTNSEKKSTLKIKVTASDRSHTKEYNLTCYRAYIVTYDGNEGLGTPPDAGIVRYNTEYQVAENATLSKSGYTFGGWKEDKNAAAALYKPADKIKVTSDKTLYAHYVQNGKLTVTFDSTIIYKEMKLTSSSGTTVTAGTDVKVTAGIDTSSYSWLVNGTLETAATGKELTFPTAGKSGSFVINCTAAKDGISYSGSLTLIVKSPTPTCTLYYDANGGTGSLPADQKVASGSNLTVAAKPSNLKRTGYNFKGWNTSYEKYKGTTYQPSAGINLTKNICLYAKWISTAVPDSITDGATITLSGNLNTEQQEDLRYALQKTTATGLTLDMKDMTNTELIGYGLGGCNSIKVLILPKALKEVPYMYCHYAKGLETVHIPYTVTCVGSSAFACLPAKLKTIYFYSTTLPSMDRYSFSAVIPTIVYVPTGKVDDYKNAFNILDRATSFRNATKEFNDYTTYPKIN